VVEDRVNPGKDGKYTLTWDVIMSEPAVSYTSVTHTLQLRRITTSKQTVIEAISDYSSDSSMEVIQDSRFKKLELFKALRTAISGKPAQPSLQEYIRRATEAEAALRAIQRRMDVLEKVEDRKEGGGGGDMIMGQATGRFLPDVKIDEVFKAVHDFLSKTQSKVPGLRMHSFVPIDENRFLNTQIFDSHDAFFAYLHSNERKMFYEAFLKKIDFPTFKLTIYGPVSAAAKEALTEQNPIYLSNNGFSP